MEPIRPDDDELRAEAPVAADNRHRTTEPGKKRAAGGAGGGSGRLKKPSGSSGNGSKGGGVLWLWLLLVVVAVGAGAGWYVQNERMSALQVQLQETEEWARQSKLALARFEGDLSETGESLQERGSSLEDQIAAQGERLDTADSEIRKLWAIANERNKGRLDEHEQRLAGLDKQLAESGKNVTDLEATLAQARSSLQGDVQQLDQRLTDEVSALERASQENASQLETVQEQLAGVDEQVDRRLQRFQREQKLTLDGLDGRIAALEQEVDAMAGNKQLDELRGELDELRETVEAIDASRSQLTSRLVRLSEEVNQLRSR